VREQSPAVKAALLQWNKTVSISHFLFMNLFSCCRITFYFIISSSYFVLFVSFMFTFYWQAALSETTSQLVAELTNIHSSIMADHNNIGTADTNATDPLVSHEDMLRLLSPSLDRVIQVTPTSCPPCVLM
jgi:hypothetical protein